MKVIFGLLLAVSFCLGASAAPNIFGAGFMKTLADTVSGIAYQLVSTVRVVANVCACKAGQITDERAADFFNCYDKAPAGGRAIYTDCQIKVGGVEAVMNTTDGISKTCGSLYTFPKYAMCLKSGFKAAGIDMGEAVTDVNKCEEEVIASWN